MGKVSFAFFVLLVAATIGMGQATGSISGTVTVDQSTALHGAEVHIIQLKLSAETDDAGNYQFTDVPTGRYTVLVHKEGFADQSRIVDVASAGAVRADFRLTI